MNRFTKHTKLKITFAVLVVILFICMILSSFLEEFLFPRASDSYVRFRDTKLKASSSDSSWKLWMFMYDSEIGKGKEQLSEDIWHATSNETRVLTVQVNFHNEDVKTTYAPGELEITVDNLGVVYPTNTLGTTYKEVTTISADKETDSPKKYPWSYRYDRSKNQYIFTNNDEIKENNNFEGTVQLAYEFQAKYLLTGSDVNLSASLTDKKNQTNTNSTSNINFQFTSTERPASITKRSEKLQAYDGLGENAKDYIWVKYYVDVRTYDATEGVRGFVYDGYLQETLLSGCVLLDGNQKEIKPDTQGIYKIPCVGSNSSNFSKTNDIGVWGKTYYYIGYPVSQYNNTTITEETKWIGKMQDSYYCYGSEKEAQVLAEGQLSIDLNQFEIIQEGEYKLSKNISSYYNKQSYNKIVNPKYGDDAKFYFEFTSVYMGEKYNFKIGDDLLYITDLNGKPRMLNDNEYHFKEITIDKTHWLNGNNVTIEDNKYDMQLFVRHSGQDDYVQYQERIKFSSKTIKFEEEDIVGWYIEIYDLEEGIKVQNYIYGLTTTVNIQTDANIALSGSIYNFNNLEIYTTSTSGDKTIKNVPEQANYLTYSRTLKIDEYDMQKFGHYVQRGEARTTYGADIVDLGLNSSIIEQTQDNEFFYRTLRVSQEYDDENLGTQAFNGYKIDIIFPLGVQLNASIDEIIDLISLSNSNGYKNIKKQDGTFFTQDEYIEFLKRNIGIKTDKNYLDSGQLWMELTLNFEKEPINIYSVKTFVDAFTIPLKIPYESYFTNGQTYPIKSYISFINDEEENYIPSSSRTDTEDVDNDGLITDKYMFSTSVTATIVPAVSSYQEVNKSVWTDTSENQWLSDIASVTYSGNYKYKLRVRTGINDIQDLVIYDNLETSGAWQGTFTGIDLSFTKEQGYNPTVYYSTNINAKTMKESPSDWLPYNDGAGVDKSKVKALAFDYGTQKILSGNLTYVIVEMKAPENVSIKDIASNSCYTKWTAIDSLGGIVQDMTGISSNVSLVAVPQAKKDLTIYKIWEDSDDALHLRPDSVNITLYQNGVEYKKETLKASEGWKHVFNVPVSDENGVLYEYSIKEDQIDLYSSKVKNTDTQTDTGVERSFTITNTLKEDEVYLNISGQKIWEDNNNRREKRPENIQINLLQNGSNIAQVTTDASKNWFYEFKQIPIYKSRTEKYTYTVQETEPEYYSSQIKQLYSNGLKIKFNELSETQSLSYDYIEIYYNYNGTMYKAGKWGGNNFANTEVIIPSKDFYLYWKTNGSNNSYYGFKFASIENISTVFDEKATKASLPNYEVEEISGSNYPESQHSPYENNLNKIWHYSAPEDTDSNNESIYYKFFNITNTLGTIPAVVTSNVQKTGTDRITKTDAPVSYTIKYTASIEEYEGNATITIIDTLPYPLDEAKTQSSGDLNGGKYNPADNTITWTETKNDISTINGADPYQINIEKTITIIFKDLDTSVQQIVNTVQGNVSLDSTKQKIDSNVAKHTTITAFAIDIPVSKQWDHGNSIYSRPSSVTLQLKDTKNLSVVVASCKLSEQNGWKNTFKQVPKYDDDGEEIQYTVEEVRNDEVKYYSPSVQKNETGFTVLNTFIGPEISQSKEQSTQYNKNYVIPGERITYTITVTNSGGVEKDVIIKDSIPQGTTFVEGSISVSATEVQGKVFSLDDLTNKGITVNVPAATKSGSNVFNGTVTVTFSVTVNSSYNGNISNVATVDKNPDNPGNNVEQTNEVHIPVLSYQKSSVVTFRKNPESTLQGNNVSVGDTIKYTIRVSNTGTETVNNITVKDTVPEGTLLLNIYNEGTSKENEITWNIPQILAQNYVDVSFEVEVKYSKDSTNTITNVALVDSNRTNQTDNTYNKPEIVLDSSIQKTTTEKEITSKDTKIYHEITFNATIENFSGRAVVTLVDTLPYPIDINNSELSEGEYKETIVDGHKVCTITWQKVIDDIYTFKPAEPKTIEITKCINLKYIYENLNDTTGSMINKVNSTIQLQEPEDNEKPTEYHTVKEDFSDASAETLVKIPTKVVVHHYIYDEELKQETQVKIAPDDILDGIIGQTYSTNVSPSVPQNYACKNIHPEKYSGKMTEEEIVVIYYYSLIPSVVTNEIDKSSTLENLTLTREDKPVPYTISYTASITDYIGKATIEIKDVLPAKIDLTKSNLDNGHYDEETNSIIWTEELVGIDTFANNELEYMGGNYLNGTYTKQYIKQIDLVYVDQVLTSPLENTATGTTKIYYPDGHSKNPGEVQIEQHDSDSQIINQRYTVNIKLEKVWDDNDNFKQHRPNGVRVIIKRKDIVSNEDQTQNQSDQQILLMDSPQNDIVDVNDAVKQGIGINLNDENNWSFIIYGFKKYDENGNKIIYEVTEKELHKNDLEYYETPIITKTESQTDTETTYSYQVVNSYKIFNTDLNGDITKIGPEEVTTTKNLVDYTINYKSEISEYIGGAKVRIIDILPFKIDEQLSDLDGGTYKEISMVEEVSPEDPDEDSSVENETNTSTTETDSSTEPEVVEKTYYVIIWEEELPHINTDRNGTYNVDITKQISVMFDKIDATLYSMENKVIGRTELFETDLYDEKDATFETQINVDGRVLVKYLDIETNEEIANQELFIGKVGKDYTTNKKEIDSYDFLEVEGKASGKYTEEDQLVIYYYVRSKTNVIVKYQDVDGNPLADDDVLPGRVKDHYKTNEKTFYGYRLLEISGEPEGEMEKETKEVIYIYERIPTKVIVKYLEKDTNKELLPEETIDGRVFDDYFTERKVIDGYRAALPEPDNKTGKMQEEIITVIYYYERIPSGIVIVKYVDKDTDEEITYIEENEDGTTKEKTYGYEITGYVKDKYSTDKKDIPYYTLYSIPDNAEGELTEHGDTVIYYYTKKPFNLSIEKELKNIILNGKNVKINNNKQGKVEIKVKDISQTTLEAEYIIKVTNTGEIDGTATIQEKIPEGYKISKLTSVWKQKEEGLLEANINLNVGETKTYEITLKWEPNENNIGVAKNIVEIVDSKNEPNFEETTKDDNISSAELITGISTGKEKQIIIAVTILSFVVELSVIIPIFKRFHKIK